MSSEAFRKELRVLLPRVLLLDLAAYLVSTLWLGWTGSFAAGLLLGTAVLIGMLFLLHISVQKLAADAKRTGTTSQRRYLLFYGLRLLLFGIAFALSLIFRDRLSPIGTAIPMLYPRLIYTADAVFHRPSSASSEKKR